MLMTAVVLIAGGEGVYRLLGYWKNGTFDGLREYDPELAWRSVRNYRGKDVEMRDKLGRPYARTLTTDAHGSRLWGTRPGAPRLLFLGDSFTEAIEVSDDKTYGAVFSRLSGFDVYVLGTGAYGSLQEAMMLKREVAEVRPDVLVLQFTRNDFTNNSLALERQTVVLQQMIRPYLVGGEVVYRFSEAHPYRLALRYSRLFARLDVMVGLALFRYYGDYNRTPPGPPFAELERQAVEVSEQLLRMIAATVSPGTRLYAFNREESHQETNRAFEKICGKTGFRTIRDIGAYVDALESRTVTTLAEDGIHFNELGNRLVGERLARYFHDQGAAPAVAQVSRASGATR